MASCGVIYNMTARRRPAAIPAFGLLYSALLLLIIVPAVLYFGVSWGYWRHTVGLDVSITVPVSPMPPPQARPLVVTLKRKQTTGPYATELEIFLNSKSLLRSELHSALRTELSKRGRPVVFVEGDDYLEFRDVAEVIDIAHEGWPGVHVVLLTPQLKKVLEPD
jgi:biopolymer transport protein ExbD